LQPLPIAGFHSFQRVQVGRDQVVGSVEQAEEEAGDPGEDPALVGDFVREDHVISRDPVGGDQQQALGVEGEDIPHLPRTHFDQRLHRHPSSEPMVPTH
jgi:hypothetical protein